MPPNQETQNTPTPYRIWKGHGFTLCPIAEEAIVNAIRQKTFVVIALTNAANFLVVPDYDDRQRFALALCTHGSTDGNFEAGRFYGAGKLILNQLQSASPLEVIPISTGSFLQFGLPRQQFIPEGIATTVLVNQAITAVATVFPSVT